MYQLTMLFAKRYATFRVYVYNSNGFLQLEKIHGILINQYLLWTCIIKGMLSLIVSTEDSNREFVSR